MIVMPACSSGWIWHCLARETGRIGHLYSPGAQRGPWPWMPYALDNGAFSCWNPQDNTFDQDKWEKNEHAWHSMIMWTQAVQQKPLWAIVPDVPGNAAETFSRWPRFSQEVVDAGIPLALAVQDGMTPASVRDLDTQPDIIAVGGSTEWKWNSVEMWANEFPRVHLLRCNAPTKLDWLESLGVESCDGTGWNRGDRKQTQGLEEWCRERAVPSTPPIWPHCSRAAKDKKQLTFA